MEPIYEKKRGQKGEGEEHRQAVGTLLLFPGFFLIYSQFNTNSQGLILMVVL